MISYLQINLRTRKCTIHHDHFPGDPVGRARLPGQGQFVLYILSISFEWRCFRKTENQKNDSQKEDIRRDYLKSHFNDSILKKQYRRKTLGSLLDHCLQQREIPILNDTSQSRTRPFHLIKSHRVVLDIHRSHMEYNPGPELHCPYCPSQTSRPVHSE